MKILRDILDEWKNLRSYGDNKKIAQKNEGVSEMDVTRAFKNGECSDTVFMAMAAFYNERKEAIKPYMVLAKDVDTESVAKI